MTTAVEALTEPTAPLQRPAPLRIGFCIDSMSVSGGSELNAVRTAELLVQNGHYVVVVTFSEQRTGMYARYRRAGIDVHGFPVGSLIGVNAARQIKRLGDFFRSQQLDVVHTHDCYSNFLMTIAGYLAGIPVVASKRWTEYALVRHYLTDFVAFRLANAVLANSAAVGDSVQRHARIGRSRITVLPNFVDAEVFTHKEDRTHWRREFGLGDDSLVFCIVARLRSEKNHSVLVDAFVPVALAYPNARLLVVGDGPEAAALQRRVAENGISSRVVFAGHLARAWRAFVAADVAMLPSRHEGFPNAVVEAMAVGIPVVASAVGGIPDAVDDGRTGLLVAANDTEALTNSMMRIASDADFRRTAGMLGHEKASRLYRADPIVDRLVGLYRRLVEEVA